MSDPLQVQVRQALAGDADEVFILVQELATTFVPTKQKFVESLSRLCANNHALVLVAEETGGQLAGYLLGLRYDTFHADGPVTWWRNCALGLMYVVPQWGAPSCWSLRRGRVRAGAG